MPWTLFTPLIAAVIALGVYRYRNRLAFSIIIIDGVPDSDNTDLKLMVPWGRVQAERLQVKNYGWRTLESVELHLKMSTRPVSLQISEPSSISKSAINTEWKDGVLRIIIASLPSSEEFKIDVIRVGHYDSIHDRFKGTGGKYKIVRLESYKLVRELIFNLLVIFLLSFVLPAVLSFVLSKP